MARNSLFTVSNPIPSSARAPCSHPQPGPPDSASSPVIVLYWRVLCACLCVLALPPSPARAPCSHPQTGPPDSATSPVNTLLFFVSAGTNKRHHHHYSRALCARLCVLALPPPPARAPCSHSRPGPPDSATSLVIVLYLRVLFACLCVLALPPSPARAPCSHPQTGPPDSATSPVIVLYSRALCARLCVLALPPFPAGFLMSAHLSRLRLFQRHPRSLVWVGVWVWDWIHSHTPPRTRSPSSRHPLFTHYPFPPRSLVCCGQPSPHKPRLVVSHSSAMIALVLDYPPLPTRTAL